MEEILKEQVYEQLMTLIMIMDWMFFFTFILASIGLKKALYLKFTRTRKKKWQTSYTILIFAAILGVIFYFITDTTILGLLISYFAATSFYQLIVKAVVTLVESSVDKFITKLKA